jgi:outer membrane protein assembly factor BamB
VTSGGRLYVSANASSGPAACLFALDAATGESAWVSPGVIGSRSAPVPIGDLVVTQLAPARLLGLDAATGSVKWRSAELGGYFVQPPSLVAGVLLVVTDGSLLGLDPASGAEKWRFAQAPLGAATGPSGTFATFASEDRTALVQPESGAGRWATPLGARRAVVKAAAASVVVLEDPPNTLLALAADDGRLLWERNIDGSRNSTLALAGDELYFSADDGKGYRVDGRTGAVVWTVATGGAVAEPVVVGKLIVFVTTAPAPAVIGVDRATGAERWRAAVPARVSVGPRLVEGSIVVGTAKGDVCRMDPTRGGPVCVFVGGAPAELNGTLATNGAQVIARSGTRRVVAVPG